MLKRILLGLIAFVGIEACGAPTAPHRGDLLPVRNCVVTFCNGIRFSQFYPDTIRMKIGSKEGSGVDTLTFDLSYIPADSLRLYADISMSTRNHKVIAGGIHGMIAKDKLLVVLLPVPGQEVGYDEVIIHTHDPAVYLTVPVVVSPAR